MSQPLMIIANPVRAKLVGASREHRHFAYEYLSYLKSDGQGFETRESLFDHDSCLFPAGFADSLSRAFLKAKITVPVRKKSAPDVRGPDVMQAYLDVNPFGYSERYAYQPETVRRLIRQKSMIARIATGGGKSIIARTAVRAIGLPSIFLTTRQVLMYQMQRGFESAGIRTGVMGDGEWSPIRGCNVAMVQTLAARLANSETREATLNTLSKFQLAILEEAHESSATSFMNTMNAMPNAHYRLALTATPFMRADEEANMRLQGVVGRVGIVVTEESLISKGILAKPYFVYRRPKMPATVNAATPWQKAYKLGIVENDDRNQIVVDDVKQAKRYGLTSMVLVQRKNHGERLMGLLRANGVRAKFIFGDHSQKERDTALAALGSGEIDCLIGSTILDVGVDVPAVGLIVLAGGGKAEVALRQRIGRGLREKKSGPNVCIVVDFEDNKNRNLRSHYRARRGIVEATSGFKEGILSVKGDLPLSSMGFTIKS